MLKFRIAGETSNKIDVCQSCDEAWLDEGEWELLGALKIQHKLNSIFTDPWQRNIREENAKKAQEKRFEDLLGEEELKKYRAKRMYGIKRRIQDQKIMSRPPYGYKIEDGKLIVDEEVRPKLVEIFQMFEDNVTMSTISNKYDIPRSTLAYLRKNPIYRTGEYYWKGKIVYQVEPVIREGDIENRDEDDFYS